MSELQDINMLDIMAKQPVTTFGMIGHVADGKSSIVKHITKKSTQAMAAEREKGITIKLGYANAKIFKCSVCPRPKCYSSGPSSTKILDCENCNGPTVLVNHVSFIDSPGHHALTSTMLSGTCIMDYTILVESILNSNIPAPQTWEHMVATNIAGIKNGMVCLNKIDMVPKKTQIVEKIAELKSFVDKFKENQQDHDKPIIPVSAVFGINIDTMCEYICSLPIKDKLLNESPILIGVRSFDINKSRQINKGEKLKGGAIGGSLTQGVLRVGDDIEIYPGYTKRNTEQTYYKEFGYYDWVYYPIKAKICSIHSETEELDMAVSGGLIGIQLDIDPSMSRDDKLAGHVLVKEAGNFKVCTKMIIKIETVFPELGLENELRHINLEEGIKVKLTINGADTKGLVIKFKKNKKNVVGSVIHVILDEPVAVDVSITKVILSSTKNEILAKCSIDEVVLCDTI